jgi:hypothetical protein
MILMTDPLVVGLLIIGDPSGRLPIVMPPAEPTIIDCDDFSTLIPCDETDET